MASLNVRAARWSTVVRIAHWVTVLLLSVQLFISFALMGRGMATVTWLPLHLSLGYSLLGITVVRVFNRWCERRVVDPVPILPLMIQIALYASLLVVSVTGWLAYKPAPFMPPATVFGVVPMPGVRFLGFVDWPAIHRTLVWMFLGLVGLHIAAMIVHIAVLKDGAFDRMSLRPRSQAKKRRLG